MINTLRVDSDNILMHKTILTAEGVVARQQQLKGRITNQQLYARLDSIEGALKYLFELESNLPEDSNHV